MTERAERLSFHGKVVAWGFLLLGLTGMALTAALFVVFGGSGVFTAWQSPNLRDPADSMLGAGLLMMFGVAFGIAGGVLSVPSFLTGVALLRRRRSGIAAAVAISLLAAIFLFPIGTVLGVYAVWALCLDPERSPDSHGSRAHA